MRNSAGIAGADAAPGSRAISGGCPTSFQPAADRFGVAYGLIKVAGTPGGITSSTTANVRFHASGGARTTAQLMNIPLLPSHATVTPLSVRLGRPVALA